MFTVAAMSFSCAEEVTVNSADLENESLKLWMAKYYPDYPEVETGLFYKIIKGENPKGESPDSSGDWVRVNYVGRDLQNNYFANTYKPLANHLGTFSYLTHFVPVMSQFVPSGRVMSPGVITALMDMQVGDSVDIFMSTRWASNGISSAPFNGFEGNISSVSNKPTRMSLRFISMTDSPRKVEEEQVIAYAVNKLKLEKKDTIKPGLYYKIIDAKPKADTIPSDSTIGIKYTGRFLDNFVFDTNVEEVAKENNLPAVETNDDTVTPWAPLSFNYDASSFVDGFKLVVKKMRVGETAIAVFTSKYGYGEAGKYPSADDKGVRSVIQPYDPLVFEIKVLTPAEMKEFE